MTTETMKDLPEVTSKPKKTPRAKKLDKESPELAGLNKDVPKESSLEKELPPIVNPENVIRLGEEDIEIKPTKLLYQRNRVTTAYRILEIYPLPDVLAMEKGVLDPERDGDAIVFDFLTAIFDNEPGDPNPTGTAEKLKKYYDGMTSEDIERAVNIFKRLNHIEDKEEAAKNRVAKAMTH